MSSASALPRTRKVKTEITEDQPIPESASLGMPWEEFLATCPDDELDITTVKLYRIEPAGSSGYIERLQPAERIDEQWIKERHGGGVYAVGVRVKNGKSAYERGIRILGDPKLPNAPAPAAVQTSANGAGDANARLADLVDKLIDKLSNLQTPQPPPAPSAAH